MGGFLSVDWRIGLDEKHSTEAKTDFDSEKDGGDLMSDAAKWEGNILTRECQTFNWSHI